MKTTRNIFLIALALTTAFSSCKRKGCADDDALNFNPKAEKDNGTCIYAPDSGNVMLNFVAVQGNQEVTLDQFLTDPNGNEFNVEMLKFYISNMELTSSSGESYEVLDAGLIDFEDNHTSVTVTVPAGTYNHLEFGIGLNEKQNGTDPSSYPDDHPMSITSNTYWSWASKYRFVMFEGRVDTTGNQDYIGYSYHTGFDKNYRVFTAGQFDYQVSGGANVQHTFRIDVEQIFFNPADTIDYTDPSLTQSHSDTPLGTRITDNFVDAISEE